MNASLKSQLATVRNELFGSPIPKRRLSKPRQRRYPQRVFAAPSATPHVECNSVTVKLPF